MPLEGRSQAPRAGKEEGFREPAERTALPGLLGSQTVKPRLDQEEAVVLMLGCKGASAGGPEKVSQRAQAGTEEGMKEHA